MAQLLRRLGQACARHRLVTIVAWLVLLAAAGGSAAAFSGPTSNSFSIPGTESTQALDELDDELPAMSASGASAELVFEADAGERVTDPKNAKRIAGAVQQVTDIEGVVGVTKPLQAKTPTVSKDQRTALATVTFSEQPGAVDETAIDAVQDVADDVAQSGLRTEVGGSALQEVPKILGPTEIVGVAIAFMVLLLTYGSLVAAGANILTALIGVGIGASAITALTGFVDLQSTTSILAVMLGLAVGIDYALFIFARFRSELRDGYDVDDAVGRAVGTAGSAVVFAGTTVVIALAGLTVVGIPFLTQMGLAASGTVVVAVAVALTLVPALLRTLGTRILRRRERAAVAARSIQTGHHGAEHSQERRSFLSGWANLVSGRPVAALLGAVVLLGLLSAPVASLQTALPTSGTADPASSERQAYDLVSDAFGPGVNGPLLLLVQGDDAGAAAKQVGKTVSSLDGVGRVLPPSVNQDGDAAVLTVIPMTGPTDDETTALVHDIRAAMDEPANTAGADVSVTGQTAVNIDVDNQLSEALPAYLALIVGLALILLLLMFRSLFVPVLATVGFLLSFGAGLGAAVATYQWGWLSSIFGIAQPAPLMSMLPIICVGILFGLAMDYQVFLVARIHEAYAHGTGPKEAVVKGFRQSAPVVIAAATIMGVIFAGFAGSPDPMIGSIALTLTVGVLADAFVVRMVIMPALLSLVGHSGWWLPRWLGRALPHVDVEGKALERTPEPEPAAR